MAISHASIDASDALPPCLFRGRTDLTDGIAYLPRLVVILMPLLGSLARKMKPGFCLKSVPLFHMLWFGSWFTLLYWKPSSATTVESTQDNVKSHTKVDRVPFA